MKNELIVVPASYEILDELDRQSLPVRIEHCGRLCYKSEDNITEESAVPFCREIIKRKHNSVMEMGVVTLRVECGKKSYIDDLFRCQPKYINIDCFVDSSTVLITGSIRAFREMFIFNPFNDVSVSMVNFLSEKHPYFFEDIKPMNGFDASKNITVRKIPLVSLDWVIPKLKAKHRYIAVKFIVNRAVTHEIVRHRPCIFLQESQRYCRYSEGKFGSRVTFIKPAVFFKNHSASYKIWEEDCLRAEATYMKLLDEENSAQAARTVLPNSCKTELILYTNLRQWHHIFHMRTSKAAEPSMREVMIPLQQEFQEMFPEQGEFNKRLPDV